LSYLIFATSIIYKEISKSVYVIMVINLNETDLSLCNFHHTQSDIIECSSGGKEVIHWKLYQRNCQNMEHLFTEWSPFYCFCNSHYTWSNRRKSLLDTVLKMPNKLIHNCYAADLRMIKHSRSVVFVKFIDSSYAGHLKGGNTAIMYNL
jgi:hypothetical protein